MVVGSGCRFGEGGDSLKCIEVKFCECGSLWVNWFLLDEMVEVIVK